MSNTSPSSLGHPFLGPSLSLEETGTKTEGEYVGQEEPLYVAWASTPRRSSPALPAQNPDSTPKAIVDIDVVIVFGLFDDPQFTHEPFRWLCNYLNQLEGDSRIIHFKYHPRKDLRLGKSHTDIGTLSELLLYHLTGLRARGPHRSLVFLAFDIGCMIALTIASRSQSLHKEIFNMCRILVFFNCLHQSADVLDIENKLARFLYGRGGGPSSHIQPTVAALPSLATSILEINESFIESRFPLWGFLISTYEDAKLGLRASQMLEHHLRPIGIPFEYKIMLPFRDDTIFVPKFLGIFHMLMSIPVPRRQGCSGIQNQRFPFDDRRAFLSLATPMEPITVAGDIAAPIELSSIYLSWLDLHETPVLYVYSSRNTDDLVQRTSEHVFFNLQMTSMYWRIQLVLYYSFDPLDIRSQSLSSMLWTFLTHCRKISSGRLVQSFLGRLYEEQACTEEDLLSWFELCMTSYNWHVCFVINYFDVCPEKSRDTFLRFVRRNATGNENPPKVFLTSRGPAVLKAELSSWPSIDLATEINLPKNKDEAEQNAVAKGQEASIRSETRPTLPKQETAKSCPTSIEGAKVADALALSILSEQQLRRNLSSQEILLETTSGVLETYTLEAVLDRVLRSIPDQNKTRLAVAFLLFATRPLSSKEFATILFLGSSIDDGESVVPTWDLFQRLEMQRTAWFAGITVNKHSGIRLAHPRLEDTLRTPSHGAQRYLWQEAASTAHYDIAHICLEYLIRVGVQEQQNLLSEQPFIVDADLGFASYAVQYWPHHFALAQSNTNKEAMETLRQKLAGVDLRRWSKTIWLLSNPFSRSRDPLTSPFAALIKLGYLDILKPGCTSDVTLGIEEAARAGNTYLINSLLEIDGQDHLPSSALMTAVMAAISGGNETLAIKLINRLSIGDRYELSKRGKDALFRAARLGLDRLVRKLLEVGTPVDPEISMDKDILMTPLCAAASTGHTSTVKILLRYGANAHFEYYLQQTPLHLAILQGNPDIVHCLMEQGGGSNESSTRIIAQPTLLCLASVRGKPRLVEKLLELGADPSAPDNEGWLPIILATIFRHRQTVRIYLDHSVDTEMSDSKRHEMALLHAIRNGDIEICRQLLERGMNPSSSLFQSLLPFELIIRQPTLSDQSRITLAKLLVDYKMNINATRNVDGMSALSLACAHGQFEFAEFLLEFNPDVNIVDRNGGTALFEATKVQSIHLVQMLLDRGADANTPTSTGNIPLHMCQGSPELTRLLVAHTKNIDVQTTQGVTQLMAAASKGWTESAKILLEHKADVNATATYRSQWAGWTPVMFAACYHFAGIITILAEAGADLKKKAADGLSPLHLIFESPTPEGTAELDCLNALMEFQTRIDIHQANKTGETALHYCARVGHLRAVQRLVRAGASLTQKDSIGYTALGHAVRHHQHEVVLYLLEQGVDPNITGGEIGHGEGPLLRACQNRDYSIAKLLIDYGADVNCDSASGYGTPLMAACLPFSHSDEDTEKLVQHLLELDVDLNITSRYVGSPLAAAAWSSRPDIVRTLLNRGAAYDVGDILDRKPIHFAAMNGEANFRIIEEAGAKLTEVDILDRSVLHYAAQGGRLQVIRQIFELLPEVDINTRDIDGWTPLCWAAWRSTALVMENRASEPTDLIGVVRYLLERGADRFVECKIGDDIWTPFRIFSYMGAPEEVTTLLRPRVELDLDTDDTTENTDDQSPHKGKVLKETWKFMIPTIAVRSVTIMYYAANAGTIATSYTDSDHLTILSCSSASSRSIHEEEGDDSDSDDDDSGGDGDADEEENGD
ncbi:ankyrin repeat-containing domain protein [Nemania abortiva]|nr:ankyrin repeat-containing domain protein [Nemania abortiva]